MASKSKLVSLALLRMSLSFAWIAMAQENATQNKQIIRTEAERLQLKSKLAAALDRDYGNQSADELLMLAIQQSDIAVPEIKQRLSTYRRDARRKVDQKA